MAVLGQALPFTWAVDLSRGILIAGDVRVAKLVALVVSARKLRSLKAWEQDMRKRCAGAAFVRVADVPREPVVTHEDVARKLRGRVPPEVSVLIDLEGAWVSAFRLDPSEVSALVFDREGRLQDRFRGRRGEALIARVVKALETAGACEAAR